MTLLRQAVRQITLDKNIWMKKSTVNDSLCEIPIQNLLVGFPKPDNHLHVVDSMSKTTEH